MAFIRNKSKTIKWPVSVESPVDGGRFETESFDAVFKRVGRKEFQQLIDRGDIDLVEAVLVGWEGVKDESEKDISFTPAALRDMLDDPCFTKGVIKAYLETLEGAKAKN